MFFNASPTNLTTLNYSNGFSLLEILTTLSLVGILILLAYPSYQNHIVHVRHNQAAVALFNLASSLEEYHIENQSYQNTTFENLHIKNPIAEGSYTLSIDSVTDSSYQISATPLARQATIDTSCGSLILNENGEKRSVAPRK
jgi:type IV pilus assembly protein PilE